MKGNCGECARRCFCEIDPDKCDEWPDPVPSTNADHIRAMTDEELATSKYIPCPYDVDKSVNSNCGWVDREQTCMECKLGWLKQPYRGAKKSSGRRKPNRILNLFCYVTEKEIRAWMDGEIARLGEHLEYFIITWEPGETLWWLTMWSTTKRERTWVNGPRGDFLYLGDVYYVYGMDPMDTIQQEGRKLYYKLKKDYPVKRALGHC